MFQRVPEAFPSDQSIIGRDIHFCWHWWINIRLEGEVGCSWKQVNSTFIWRWGDCCCVAVFNNCWCRQFSATASKALGIGRAWIYGMVCLPLPTFQVEQKRTSYRHWGIEEEDRWNRIDPMIGWQRSSVFISAIISFWFDISTVRGICIV